MKKYQLIAVLLILLAVILGYWTYTQSPTEDASNEDVEVSENTNEEDKIASVAWKTFVTASTDRINASFDYPDDTQVVAGSSDIYTSFALMKENSWDAVVLIIPEADRADFEAGLLAAGGTATTAVGDRGTFYSGGMIGSSALVNGSLELQKELGGSSVRVFIPTQQPSPGYTSVLIDADADWSEEAFDYFTRTFAFIIR